MNRIVVALLAVAFMFLPAVLTTSGADAAARYDPIPGDPSVAMASGSLLPFTGFFAGDVVVDEGHGQVFVSGGRGNDGVAVADLDGHVVRVLPGLVSAESMLLSDDGATLYVALADGNAIAAVDTTTFDVLPFPTGDSCPRQLAQLGVFVYFTESCNDYSFRVMRLDPATGEVAAITLAGEVDDRLIQAGPIVSDPAWPNRFYVADNNYYDPSATDEDDRRGSVVLAFDIDEGDGLTATRTARQSLFNHEAIPLVSRLGFSPDGDQLAVVHRGGMVALNPADLSPTVTFEFHAKQEAVSVGNDFVASVWGDGDGYEVMIHRRSGSFGRRYFFDVPGAGLGADSVEWASDRLFAVASDDGSNRLFAFTDFALPAPYFDAMATDGHSVDDPHFISGWLTAPGGAPFPGREVAAWRSGPDGLVSLGTVVSSSPDGRFEFEDTPAVKGTYRYTVLYRGEPGMAPVKWVFTHPVRGWNTRLTLNSPPVVGPEEPIVVHGSLAESINGAPVEGATVSLTQTHNGQTTMLPEVLTDSEGRFSFEAPGGEIGEYVFRASFDGNGRVNPSGSSVSTWVKRDVVLDLTPPASHLLWNQPMSFHGRATTADGQPLPGRSIVWERYSPGATSPSKSATVVTGADGAFSFTDQNTARGMVRWRVVFRGDAEHDVADTDVFVPVYLYPSTIQVSTDRPTYAYDTDANLEVSISGGSTGTFKVYAEPHGQPRSLIHEGRTTAASPDAVLPLHLTRNTAITTVFDADAGTYSNAPNQATTTISVRPRLNQGLLGSYAKSRQTHLVRTRVDPRLTLQVSPQLSGRCVRVRVERYRTGAFRFVRRTDCIPLNRDSRAVWTLTGNPPVDARFRLRYETPGDLDYSASVAPWTTVRFTR